MPEVTAASEPQGVGFASQPVPVPSTDPGLVPPGFDGTAAGLVPTEAEVRQAGVIDAITRDHMKMLASKASLEELGVDPPQVKTA